ncbi:MAG: hypothetical protein NTV51_03840, partial [Verrucomicrobia bacterium]|nr:hypothetical protein [Verrucomicrobiota bacterium]
MLFDSDKRFTPYKPTYQGKPKDVAGYFVGGDDETVIALNLDVETDDESSPAETIFHEYVHLLLHTRGMKLPSENRTNSAKLAKFLVAADAAPGNSEAAFREIFGTGFDQLEQQLRTYLQGGRYFTRRVPAPLKDFAAKVVIRPATELERDLALTNLRWRVHRSGETMLAALHFADRNPTWPRPQELLGAVAAADGEVTNALARWTKAAELGSTNPFVLVQAVRGKLLDSGGVFDPEERIGAADVAQMRAWLDRAVQLSPAYDDAWEVLAHVEAHAPEFRIGIVNELQIRVGKMKEPSPTLLSLAVVRWRAKDLATANSIVKLVTSSRTARAEIKGVAHLLETRFAQDV